MGAFVTSLAGVTYATFALNLIGCEQKPEFVPPPPVTAGPHDQPTAKTPDRLPPGKLLEGKEEIFGFVFPRGVKVERPAAGVARGSGPVNFDALVEYAKDRLVVRYAEMHGTDLVFDNARVKGGDPKQPITVHVKKRGVESVLEVEGPLLVPATPGLSEKQRWEKVGLTPEGRLIDPHGME